MPSDENSNSEESVALSKPQSFNKDYLASSQSNWSNDASRELIQSLIVTDQDVVINSPVAALPGITNTQGWTDEQIVAQLEAVKQVLDWENTIGSARKWWEAFENENKQRWALLLRLAEEIRNRKATITEFFLAYIYSNTDNIQANLHYLDYTRLKKEEERKKKEAAAKVRIESISKKDDDSGESILEKQEDDSGDLQDSLEDLRKDSLEEE